MGPVQVLVVGFDQPEFSGEVIAELTRLRAAGIVRLVDVLLVARNADGTFETLQAPLGLPPDIGALTAELLGGSDGDRLDRADTEVPDAWSLADSVPPGTTAAVALLEHIWAEPLRDAIRRAGGRPLDETWLAPADLELLESRAP